MHEPMIKGVTISVRQKDGRGWQIQAQIESEDLSMQFADEEGMAITEGVEIDEQVASDVACALQSMAEVLRMVALGADLNNKTFDANKKKIVESGEE